MNDRTSDALSQTSVGQGLLMGLTVTQRAPNNADPTATTGGWADGQTFFWDDSPNVIFGIYSARLDTWATVTLTP